MNEPSSDPGADRVFDNEVAGYDEAWDLVGELPSLFFGGATIAELKHWVERMTAVLEKAQASQNVKLGRDDETKPTG